MDLLDLSNENVELVLNLAPQPTCSAFENKNRETKNCKSGAVYNLPNDNSNTTANKNTNKSAIYSNSPITNTNNNLSSTSNSDAASTMGGSSSANHNATDAFVLNACSKPT